MSGNRVMIETTSDAHSTVAVALCHLQKDSVTVTVGQAVRIGDQVGRCGNSGNSTEPHLHLHALDGRDLVRSEAVPITFRGSLPHNNAVLTV